MSWNEPGGDNKDPWSGRGNDKQPPDLDEVIRSLQEKLSKLFGGDDNGGGGGYSSNSSAPNPSMTGLGLLVAGALVVWALLGFYIVDEGKNGVETRFGKYTRTTQSGLHWIAVPIEQKAIIDVKQQHVIEVGYRKIGGAEQAESSILKEALMLTADENIVDVRLSVQYQIENAENFLFNIANPHSTLKQVTESVERGVVGGNTMDYVLTEGRSEIVAKIKEEIQKVLNDYKSGIRVTAVNLQDVQPPEQVQNASVDMIKAREDKQRLINEANAYYNDVVPKARGAAARKLQEAEGYKQQVIAQAEGEASRFSQLLAEYKKSPEIMRKRLYIEAIETVLSDSNTVMVNTKEGNNNLLYLPLDKMMSASTPAPTPSQAVSTPEPVNSKPAEIEKPLAFDRASARNRDMRGRNNAD